MELLWVVHHLLESSAETAPGFAAMGSQRGGRLAQQLREFWGDGIAGGAGELVIIADAIDRLLVPTLDELLLDLPAPAGDPASFRLRSESPGDRAVFIERLSALQRDDDLRRRYARLLLEIWRPMKREWETKGLPQVLADCRRVAHQLELGRPLPDVVPAYTHVSRKRSEWGSLVTQAWEDGDLILCPGYFGGSWSLWDFPRHVVIGFNGNPDPMVEVRTTAERLAPRLRTLGDPTRLSILLYISKRPTSVGELAQRFGLAQPTVSAHLRGLRTAGLVVGVRSGGRTVYQVEEGRLTQLFQDLTRAWGLDPTA
ncbi:MAG TPA: metalloregulator ArsR/SmtB family transcription factor [Candidatus Dormibacteraeota bacterium]